MSRESVLLSGQKLLKGIADKLGAFIGLVFTSPIFLTVAIALKIKKEHVFFLQERIGLDQQPFKMYKFTTMIQGSENHGSITRSNDMRITKLGAILRKFKLNEVPQLINVLKGEMSFVGPRPLPKSELERYYTPIDRARIYSAKPGITGRASMEFSDEEDCLGKVENFEEYFAKVIVPQKAKLEIWYVENWSIFLDLKIFFGTIFKLIWTFVRYFVNRLVRRKR